MWADLPEIRKEAEQLEAEAAWWRLQAEMLSKPSDAGEGVTGHGQRVPCTFVDELGGRDTPISEHTFDSVVDEVLTGLNRTLPQGRRPGFTTYDKPMRNHHRKDITINPNGSYSYGRIFGQNFKEVVEKMLAAYGPKQNLSSEGSWPAPRR